MSFPTELPKQAIGKIFSVVRGEKPDADQLALAAYELVGYGLYLGFGDAKYAAGISPQILALVNSVIESLDIKAFKDIPVVEIVQFVVTELAKGTRPGVLAFKVLINYGPKAFTAVNEIVKLFKKVTG